MERIPVSARIAHSTERERIWATQVALMPAFAEFEATAGRRIPVVVLERTHVGDPARTVPRAKSSGCSKLDS